MPPPLNSLKPKKVKLKDSFASLKFVPRFFGEIKKVNPPLFYLNIFMRLISAFLPVAMLWVGKEIDGREEEIFDLKMEFLTEPAEGTEKTVFLLPAAIKNKIRFNKLIS